VYVLAASCQAVNVGVFPGFTAGQCLVVQSDFSLGGGACGGGAGNPTLAGNNTWTGINSFTNAAGTNLGVNGVDASCKANVGQGSNGNFNYTCFGADSTISCSVAGTTITADDLVIGNGTFNQYMCVDNAQNVMFPGIVYIGSLTVGGFTSGGSLTAIGNVTGNAFVSNRVGGTAAIMVLGVPGAPSGVCPSGSIFMRSDGGAGTTFYTCVASAWVANGSGSGTVTGVTGSGNIASSGGTTPNITFTGLLPVANGGSGTSTPSLIAGTNVSITGSWPNQTVNSSAGGGGPTLAATQTWTGVNTYAASTTTGEIIIGGTSSNCVMDYGLSIGGVLNLPCDVATRALLNVNHMFNQGTYQDATGAAGTSGQILSSTGTGTLWITSPAGHPATAPTCTVTAGTATCTSAAFTPPNATSVCTANVRGTGPPGGIPGEVDVSAPGATDTVTFTAVTTIVAGASVTFNVTCD
jgi:hypothetical protein